MATANYAIHLNGTTQYFTVADDAAHDYATGDAFTFGLVFRLDKDFQTAGTPAYLWSRQNQHAMYVDHGELVYYFNGAGGAQTWHTGVRVRAEKTHHLTLTGAEDTNTTVVLYLDGVAEATTTLTGGMPADTNTALYVGVDYGHSTAGQFFKGNICGWYQSNTTAISAANALIAYHSGVYNIDTVEGISGLVDSVGFEENTGTTYDNALNAGIDGSGQGTPTWIQTVDPWEKHDYNGTSGPVKDFTGVGQSIGSRILVKRIDWKGEAIADGAELLITDFAGNLVFHTWAKADDTGEVRLFEPPQWFTGLKTATMGAGLVHVDIG